MNDSNQVPAPIPVIQLRALEQSEWNWTMVRQFLRRYWLLIAGVFATTVLGAYGAVSLMREEYAAGAKLLIRMGRENLDPPPTVRNTFQSMGLRREDVNSEIHLLKSRRLIEETIADLRIEPGEQGGERQAGLKAVARSVRGFWHDTLGGLGLRKQLSPMEGLIGALERKLDVTAEKEADVLSVTLVWPDRELAVRFLERYISAYQRRRVQVRQDAGIQALLDQAVEEAHRKLSRIEAEKLAWKESNRLSLPEDQKTLLLRQVRELAAERSQTMRDVEALNREIEETGHRIAATPAIASASRQETVSPVYQALRERLTKLQLERAQLLSSYQSESEKVRNMEGEIARVRELLEKEQANQISSVVYEPNPLRRALEQKLEQDSIRLQGLRSRMTLQTNQQAALESEVLAIERAQKRLTELDREQQIAEGNYLALIKRKQDADISAQQDQNRISNVSVLEPPVATFEPVYPRKSLLMLVACALGLGLGFGLALVLHYLDDERAVAAARPAGTPLPGYMDAAERQQGEVKAPWKPA